MMALVDCLSSVSGGAVSYLRNVIPRLYGLFKASGESHKLRLLVHESQKVLFPGIPASEFIVLAGPRMSGYRRVWWEFFNIPNVVAETKADVLFYPYQIGLRVNGVKKVHMLCNMDPFHFHRYEYDFKLRIRNHLLKFESRRSLSTADRVIAISRYVEYYLVQFLGIHPSKVRLIYNGSDKSFGPRGQVSRDAALIAELNIFGDFILTVGSLFPYRRCEDVIAAFGRIEPTIRRDLTLVIAGSGTDWHYSRVLDRAIAASGVADRVRLVGHVSPEAMQALYRCCRLCVIASEVEACPNIAIEAMEAGCVTVASDSPPLPEIFDGGATHFPSRDIPTLAETMQRCLSDEKLRQELSERSRTRAQDFSWDRCACETYSALVDW